jgi:Bacterial Ig-like domain (group 1)/PKD domain
MVRAAYLLCAVAFISFASACDKVPLLAPTGTVITLFATATTIPLNGNVEIVATAIENGTTATTPTATPTPTTPTPTTPTPTTPTTPTGTSTTGAGTPVQNGTLITFTTTIGRIEPSEARTHNGQVRVRLITGNQSGTAVVTAFSGGASARLENLRVGTAAAERVLLSANPQTLNASGGTSEISARVEDTSGAGISGVSVTFTADTGQLSAGSAITDADGVAHITLTTSRQTVVTANVAGKTATVTVALNPRTGITLTVPTTAVSAGQPATFTIGVNAMANIRDVRVSWGDGSSQSLGAVSASTTVAHTYQEAGTFNVSATATDTTGQSETVSSTVTVLPGQPPSVLVTANPSTAAVNQNVRLIAQVSGNTSPIVQYEWNFGSDAVPPTATTTSNQVNVRWTVPSTKFISVTVTQATGPTGDGFGTVVITTTGAVTTGRVP